MTSLLGEITGRGTDTTTEPRFAHNPAKQKEAVPSKDPCYSASRTLVSYPCHYIITVGRASNGPSTLMLRVRNEVIRASLPQHIELLHSARIAGIWQLREHKPLNPKHGNL